jgi:pimeloyl-ACP methyl ester carboxylesterase
MAGIAWGLRYPRELAGLVLINTSLAGLSPPHRRLNWRILPEVLALAGERDIARREEGILRLTGNTGPFNRELIDARVEAFSQRPVSGRTLLRQLWAASRFRPSMEKPRVPVLLLSGLGDRMVSPRCTDDIARVWCQEPRRHPTAGHDLPLDDPDWVIQRVKEWQQQVGFLEPSAS